jgi:hypothetical protein
LPTIEITSSDDNGAVFAYPTAAITASTADNIKAATDRKHAKIPLGTAALAQFDVTALAPERAFTAATVATTAPGGLLKFVTSGVVVGDLIIVKGHADKACASEGTYTVKSLTAAQVVVIENIATKDDNAATNCKAYVSIKKGKDQVVLASVSGETCASAGTYTVTHKDATYLYVAEPLAAETNAATKCLASRGTTLNTGVSSGKRLTFQFDLSEPPQPAGSYVAGAWVPSFNALLPYTSGTSGPDVVTTELAAWVVFSAALTATSATPNSVRALKHACMDGVCDCQFSHILVRFAPPDISRSLSTPCTGCHYRQRGKQRQICEGRHYRRPHQS